MIREESKNSSRSNSMGALNAESLSYLLVLGSGSTRFAHA